MTLSAQQWFAIAVGDMLLRAGYFLFFSSNILAIPISVSLTALHLIILIFFSGLMRAAIRPSKIATAITLALTNALFVLAFVSMWISSISSNRQTLCFGAAPDDCRWIEGAITGLGSQVITREAVVQVIINIVPIIAVLVHRSHSRADSASLP